MSNNAMNSTKNKFHQDEDDDVIQLDLEHGKPSDNNNTKKSSSSFQTTDDKPLAHSWLGARATSLALGLAIVFAVVFGIYFGMNAKNISLQEESSSNAINNNNNNQGGTAVSLTSLYEHNTSKDCWLLIHGNVYDLTAFVHPGGQQWITNSCGTDATQSFSAHHSQAKLKSVSNKMVGSLSTASEQQQSSTGSSQTSPNNDSETTSAAKGDFETDSDTTSAKGDDDDKDSGTSPQGGDDDEDNDEAAESSSEEETERESSGDTLESSSSAAADTAAVTCTQQFYSSTDVETHSSNDSCWLVLYDTVYDFTNFLNRHPGGSRVISSRCGTDATQAFSAERKHNEWLLKTEASGYLMGKVGSETGSFEAPCQ